MQNLAALGQADVVAQPPSTEEVWALRFLIATLTLLVWWSLLED